MTAAFATGSSVRIKADSPPGHVRTPAYVRGKLGWIERIHGDFRNPEDLAYGRDGLPRRTLYMVGFHQSDLWGARYVEHPTDTLYVDIYEHWLEIAQ